MITSFKDVLSANGWEMNKKTEADCWIGVVYIRHITAIQPIDDKNCLVWADKYFWANDIEELKDETSAPMLLQCGDYDGQLIFAATLEEAQADVRFRESQLDANKQRDVHNILFVFERLQKHIEEMNYHGREALAKELKTKRFQDFRWFFYTRVPDPDTINLDDCCNISDIFLSRKVSFRDDDNEGIKTIIDLDHVVSVECNITYNDRACIGISMDNGREFHIYEKENEDEYKALEILYA